MKVWLNKRIVDLNSAKVSVFDRGFLYGDGVFETMRSYNGRVFKSEEHLSRLKGALGAIRIKMPYGKKEFAAAIRRLLRVNGLTNAYIRVAISRGKGRVGIDAKDDFAPTVVIVAKKFTPYRKDMYKKGISARVVHIRTNEYSPVARIKSLNYLNNIVARIEAKESGDDEAILMNTRGQVTEAATSNIFLVRGERVLTPSLECALLPGVTRKIILQLARWLKLSPIERPITYKELIKADEVFLTNSLFEVMPVVKIDGRKIGDSKPGRLTSILAERYKELVRAA